MKDASQDFAEALWPEWGEQEVERLIDEEANRFVGRSAIYDARVRLDSVGSLLTRRLFNNGPLQCGRFRSIHLYCDASPIVGVQIFALCIDIVFAATVFTFNCMGACLGHGCSTTLHKTMTMLWQLWCACGPNMQTLEALLMDVTSITVEMGVPKRHR